MAVDDTGGVRRDKPNDAREAGPAGGRPHRFGVLFADVRNPFWHDMERAYRSLARDQEVEMVFLWPDPGPEAQLKALRDLLRLDLDLVIVNPLASANLAPGVIEAAQLGVPVIDAGAKMDPAAVEEAGEWHVPVHTVDFREQGRLAAQYLVDRLGPAGGAVVILEGRPGARQSRERMEGAATVLRPPSPVVVWAREVGGFAREPAAEVAARLLQQQPELRGFLCANDLMALGVADALEHRPDRPLIVGVDGIADAVAAVRAGRIDATVAFSTAEVAVRIMEVAVALLAGPLPRRVASFGLVANRLVTKEDDPEETP